MLITLVTSAPSRVASHPAVSVKVDNGCKLIGGGAIIDPVEPSNFLTASYPLDPETWFAAGKDHEIISPASITAYAIGLYDPDDIWDVQIVSATSAALSHPKVPVGLTDDYVLTGGGAIVNYTGTGNMLTASFPRANPNGDGDWYIWEAHSKDHDVVDPAQLTVYAIGIRLRGAPAGSPGVRNFIVSATSPAADKPFIGVDPGGIVPDHAVLAGGGAWDEWSGAGNMLTASGPGQSSNPKGGGGGWFARGSDHITQSPAPLTAWAICLEAVGASQPARRVARRRTGEIMFPYKSHHQTRRT
jgi:hypothetical protein